MSDGNERSAKSSDQIPDQEQVSREAYRMADMVRDGKMTKDGYLAGPSQLDCSQAAAVAEKYMKTQNNAAEFTRWAVRVG